MTPDVATISARAADALRLAHHGDTARAATIALEVCRTDVLELVQAIRHRDARMLLLEQENERLRREAATAETAAFMRQGGP